MDYKKLETARAGLKNYTGTRVIKAPLADIAQVLYTCEGKVDWLSNLLSASELEQSDTRIMGDIPSAYVIHEHYQFAPGFQHRDYVLSCRWAIRESGDGAGPNRALLVMQSAEHEAKPIHQDRVRAAINLLVYNLEALPDDAGTRVDVEINLDAGGVMPVFAVNLYASTWSDKHLLALEKQTLKHR